MRRTLVALVIAGALGGLTAASPSAQVGSARIAHVSSTTAASACKVGYYKNVNGRGVHRPTHAPSRPAGASAKCRDGTYSFSLHRSGTCSHHGGVSVWY